MQPDLKQFMERLLLVVRDSFNTYGRDVNFPNADTTQKDIGYKLQAAALEFARKYSEANTTKDELMQLAKQIEGYISTGQAISTLSESEANGLIKQLYDVIEGNNPRGIR